MTTTGSKRIVVALACLVAAGLIAWFAVSWLGTRNRADEPPADPVAAAVSQWRQSIAQVGGACEDGYEAFDSSPGSVPESKIELGLDARKTCALAADRIARAAVPAAMTGDLARQAREAQSICADAYLARERALTAQIAVLDRDMTIAAYREAREAQDAVENTALSCGVSLDAIVERGGGATTG